MMPPNELDMLSDQGIGSGSYVMKGEHRRGSSLARSKDESSIGLTSLTQLPRDNTSPININENGQLQNPHIFSDEMVEVDF